MKKFLLGALTAIMLMSSGAFTEASQADYNDQCCRGYCSQYCDDANGSDDGGQYCGRYGCRR